MSVHYRLAPWAAQGRSGWAPGCGPPKGATTGALLLLLRPPGWAIIDVGGGVAEAPDVPIGGIGGPAGLCPGSCPSPMCGLIGGGP